MPSTLKAAQIWARAGYRVLPLDGKRPRIKEWQNLATTDPDLIKAWWRKWPEANVGIATGGDLVVLDVDPRNGGDESLRRLLEANGPLPETLTVKTGGGGRHYYMRNRGAPERSGKLVDGIDIKADGGYVAAPPSVHPDTGDRYRLELRVRRATFPDWIREARRVRGEGSRRLPRKIAAGERNDALFRLASSLAAKSMVEEEILAALRAANKRCVPPLPAREVATIAHSAAKYIDQWRDRPHTDLGNAERLALDHGDDLRYVPGGGWFVWTGALWQKDQSQEVLRRAGSTARKLMDVASATENNEQRTTMAKHAKASEHVSRLNAMVTLAAAQSKLVLGADELDGNSFLLNAANGTLKLKSGRLRSHRRKDHITRTSGVEFDPDARAPRWERFVGEVLAGDDELIRYVQRVVGYCLTGDTREQCLFMLVGGGANGKTTFIEVVSLLLGDYAVRADASSFTMTHRRSVRSDIARLRGARLVPAVEVESGAQMAEVLIKQVTGGDKVVASELYKGEFEFTPTFKVMLAANETPIIRGQDHAIWRRIRLIPFIVRFERPDRALRATLEGELSGILNWALEGCQNWLRSGLGHADALSAAVEAYRDDMDVIRDFFEAECDLGAGYFASSEELWRAYVAWADASAVNHPLSRRDLGAQLEARGLTSGRARVNGAQARGWRGIQLRGGRAS